MLVRPYLFRSIKLTPLFAFSRTRRPPLSPKEQPTEDEIQLPEVDFNNFNFLKSLKEIRVSSSRSKSKFVNEISKQCNEGNEECLKSLRDRQEQLIIKISQGQDKYQELRQLLALKISANMRFRKWDDIAVDIDNSIQTIKYQQTQLSKCQQRIIPLYNQLFASLIMTDHDRLHELLENSEKQTTTRRRKTTRTKNTDKTFGLETYQYLHEILLLKEWPAEIKEKYCDVVLLKAVGMFAVGRREQAIDLLCRLTSKQLPSYVREKAYIFMLTSLLLPESTSQSLSSNVTQAIASGQASILANGRVQTKQCEELVNQLQGTFRDKKLQELRSQQIESYGLLLMLICQNYYLEGNDSFRPLLTLLENKKQSILDLPLRHFKLGLLIDEDNYQQIQNLVSQYRSQQEAVTQKGKGFYQAKHINFDALRVNILKMASLYYQTCEQAEKAEELMEQAEMLQCALGVYSTKQPEFQQMAEDDWRRKESRRIPYYYFNLQLERVFQFPQTLKKHL